MVAGPQIVSSIFLATSKDWKANSALFCFGALISITLVLTAGYLRLERRSRSAFWRRLC